MPAQRPNQALYAAAAERNRQPILEVIQPVLPQSGTVLEIASGTGQHVVHFAAALPGLDWQPSDPDPANRASILALIQAADLSNVAQPLDLDVLEPWPKLEIDALITSNLLHISPPRVLPALLSGAAALLKPGGIVHIYGPFLQHGRFTSEGNARFDASLRARNPQWGLRDIAEVEACAARFGFTDMRVADMPANNFSILLRKQ
jgi:SAM-dependent methyltransferase